MGAATPAQIKKVLKARAKSKKRDTFGFSTRWMLFTAGFGALAGVVALFFLGAPVTRHLPLSSEIRGLFSDLREKFVNAQPMSSTRIIPENVVEQKVDTDVPELSKVALLDVGHPEVAQGDATQQEVGPVDPAPVDIVPADILGAMSVEQESKCTSTLCMAEQWIPVPEDSFAPDISGAKPIDLQPNTISTQPDLVAEHFVPPSASTEFTTPHPVPVAEDFVASDVSADEPIVMKPKSTAETIVESQPIPVPKGFVIPDISGAIPIVIEAESALINYAQPQTVPVPDDFLAPDISGAKPIVMQPSESVTQQQPMLVPVDFTAPDISGAIPIEQANSVEPESAWEDFEAPKAVPADFPALDVSGAIPFDMTNRCALGEVCKLSQIRPFLSDGTMSRAVWDNPRALMKSNFARGSGKVSYIWDEPLVVYFDNVLDESELDYIVETATPRFSKSLVAGPDGVPIPDQSRTSDTAWIYTSESEKVRQILTKVTALAGFSVGNAEDIGVNRYQKCQFFKPHHDYMQEHQLAAYSDFKNCQRAATALIYLSDVEEGGHSVFMRDEDNNLEYSPANPEHLAVEPKRGRVLVWYNMHPYTERVDDRTLHAGSPVKKGTKIAATVFIRNCTRTPQN